MAVKNFLYLDSDKLRSLSSQIFEGVVDEIIKTKEDSSTETESQAGGLGSGRVLGDIFNERSAFSEKSFLDDHAYSIFEDRLVRDNALIDGADETVAMGAFVKATGLLSINDHVHSAQMLRNFNRLGQAIWRVTNDPLAMEVGSNAQRPASDDRAKIGAAESQMQFHPKVVEASADIMEFGYGDLLEFNLSSGDQLYSAPLKRNYLREPEDIIVRKYSRMPQQEFSIVGVVTQIGGEDKEDNDVADVGKAASIKNAMRLLSQHADIFEKTFNRPTSGEFVIDPIAVYCEI